MSKPKWFVTFAAVVLFVAGAPDGDFAAAAAPETVRVGIITDGPWNQNETIKRGFINEIIALTSGEYDVRFPDELIIECDYSVESVRDALNRLLSDDTCHMILTLGAIASNEVTHMGEMPKPVIAPFIIDPVLQDTPVDGVSSGVKNLSYLTSPFNINRDVTAFMEYVEFEKLVVLSSGPFVEAIPQLSQRIVSAVSTTGAEIVLVRVGNSADEALAAIPEDADAVFVSGLIHLPPGEFDKIVAGINARRLPSFSLMGKMDVERGVLFGLSPDTTFPRFSRRVALHVQQVLLGVEPEDLPIAFSGGERLTVNMATARKIGVFPSWEVLTEAEQIDREERRVARTWSFRLVKEEALRVNRNLAAASHEVSAGAQDVNRSISTLLPQIDLTGTGLVIDEDRAESSFGSQPERSLTAGLSASQIIWSERAWANYSVQKKVQSSREYDYESVRLDVALEALTAFLDVLRAKTNERIVRENLKITRSNLELARTRRAIGFGGPGEVYRWEAALANNRQEAINSNTRRNLTELQLNRVLYRPLEESFATEEFGMDDPDVVRYREGLMVYFDNPYSFQVLRKFLVEEGLRLSPELHALDAAIAAQKRALDSSTYSFFSPDLVLFGGVDRWLWKDGAGSEPAQDIPVAQRDDTDWSVGVELQFPILTSGDRVFVRRQNSEELVLLRTEREALAQRVDQRIRASLHLTGAAYAGIRQRRLAADASMKNLDVILDSYSQGTVSILDLLDAQRSAFESESLAADAVYEFLIQLMEVERSIGKFYFFASQEEIDAIGDRFDRYLEENPIGY
jgi:outer membrane protein TolC/ABC-type uncharacterized transport system substrate-binding protein